MKQAFTFLLVMAAAVWSVWPMAENPNRVTDRGTDGVLIVWLMRTAGNNVSGAFRSLSDGSKNLFEGNIFYPYKNILAYSDMFFISSIWRGSFGLTMIAGQIMTTAVLWWWWKEISGDSWATAMGAIAFGLSQIRWEYAVHLQMWCMQYMLIAVYAFWKYLNNAKTSWLIASGMFLGIQIWESLLPVFFGLAIIMIISINHQFSKTKRFMDINTIKNISLIIFLTGIIGLLPLKAYWQVSREFNYQRSIRETAHNAMSLEEPMTKFLSPGLYILFTVSFMICFKHQAQYSKFQGSFTQQHRYYARDLQWLIAVLIVGAVMAMGPAMKWQGKTVKIAEKAPVPLPYAAAYYTIPGFGALRTPSRWIWLSGFAMSGIIAIGLSNYKFSTPLASRQVLSSNTKYKKIKMNRFIGTVCLLAVAVSGGTRLVEYKDLPSENEYPAVYKWLKDQPGEVIVELPVRNEDEEKYRMLYGLKHGKKLINGFSGFFPPERMKLFNDLSSQGLTQRNLQIIKELGVDYVIIHGLGETGFGDTTTEGDKIKWKDEETVVVGI